MAILRVNPNRMEVLKLKKRIVFARRGHDLLEDKLEELMRRFLDFVKKTNELNICLRPKLKKAFRHFVLASVLTEKEKMKEILEKTKVSLDLKFDTVKFMNVVVPTISLEKVDFKYNYSIVGLPLELDLAFKEFSELLPDLLKLAQLIKTCQLLAGEIETTRRRVNALEYILIPAITQTIRFITSKLTEIERSNLTRLMRIKEIVRSH